MTRNPLTNEGFLIFFVIVSSLKVIGKAMAAFLKLFKRGWNSKHKSGQ